MAPRQDAERPLSGDVDEGSGLCLDQARDLARARQRQRYFRIGRARPCAEAIGRYDRHLVAAGSQDADHAVERVYDPVHLRKPGIGNEDEADGQVAHAAIGSECRLLAAIGVAVALSVQRMISKRPS